MMVTQEGNAYAGVKKSHRMWVVSWLCREKVHKEKQKTARKVVKNKDNELEFTLPNMKYAIKLG